MRKSLYLNCITAILLSVCTPVADRGHCQDKIGPHTKRHGTVQANPRPADESGEITEHSALPSAKAIEPQRLVANRTKATMGSQNAIKKANDENFASLVHDRKGLVLVEFYADWCGPCKMQEVVLRRLTGVRLFYENAWRDNAKKKHRTKGGFGLLDSFELRDGRMRKADGDEEERLSEFRWNSVMFDSFQAGYLKKIDYAKIRKLSPAARRLYRYLDKHFYPPHRTTLVLNLRELAFEHIGMSRNYDTSQLKRELAKPIGELEQMEFINVERHRFSQIGGRRGEWQISFTLRGYSLRTRTAGKGPKPSGRQPTSKAVPIKQDQFDQYLARLPESQRRELEAEALRHSSAGFLRETVESQDDDGPLAAECRRQIVKAFLRNTTGKVSKKVA